MKTGKYSAKGAEALFAASLTYAFTGVLVRETGLMWGDKAQVAARWTLVFILLLIYGFFRKTKAKIPPEKLKYAIALGFVFASTVLFFTASIQKTTLANSLFIFYATNMATSFLLGTSILRESVSVAKIAALLFALVGLSLYAGDLAAGSFGIIFGVFAGIFGGVSNLLYKLLSGVDRNAVLRIQYGVGTIFTLLLTWFSGDQIIRTANLRGVILTVLFAFVLIAAANFLLYGYQHFDVNIGTVIMSTELVFGALLGYILYNEVPRANEFIGGILIFTGSILGSLDFTKLTRHPKGSV